MCRYWLSGFLIFLHVIVGSNYYLRQRYRPSVIYPYGYFILDIRFHLAIRRSAWCSCYRVGLSRWQLRFDPLLGKHFLSFLFPLFFLLILHFVTLQESTAFHLKFYYYYTVFILTFQPPHVKTKTMAYAPSEDSDQPGHLPSLIRVFAVRMKKAWVISYSLSAERRLIRLGGCTGWSESLLGAHIIMLVLSCGGSFVIFGDKMVP